MQYDIRTLLKAARALNNGEPFPGERLLHRLLDKTYYAHILPPLPEGSASTLEKAEGELQDVIDAGNAGKAAGPGGGFKTEIGGEFLHALRVA